jgi:hypothetical protein
MDTVIATEHIYIDEISNPNFMTDSLPTFGPSFIELYDEPYFLIFNKKPQFALFANDDDTNAYIESVSTFKSR